MSSQSEDQLSLGRSLFAGASKSRELHPVPLLDLRERDALNFIQREDHTLNFNNEELRDAFLGSGGSAFLTLDDYFSVFPYAVELAVLSENKRCNAKSLGLVDGSDTVVLQRPVPPFSTEYLTEKSVERLNPQIEHLVTREESLSYRNAFREVADNRRSLLVSIPNAQGFFLYPLSKLKRQCVEASSRSEWTTELEFVRDFMRYEAACHVEGSYIALLLFWNYLPDRVAELRFEPSSSAHA